jgi:hypothetical protein
MDRAALHERANWLRDEIARIEATIADTDSPAFQGPAKYRQLDDLRRVLARRLYELDDVERQLSGR